MKMNLEPILDAQGSAIFNVKLAEGVQYHMGNMQVRGVDQQLYDKMMADWQIKKGDVYDSTYPDLYMNSKFGKFIPKGVRIEWRNREIIHDDTKVVDLLVEIGVKR